MRNALLNDWEVEVVDAEVDDFLWLKLECSRMSSILMLAVCYLPPISLVPRPHLFSGHLMVTSCTDHNDIV